MYCTVLYFIIHELVTQNQKECVDRIIKLLYYSYSTNQE